MTPGLTYAVIRSHSLIGDLLTPEQMRALADSESLEAFIKRLSENTYDEIRVEPVGDVSMALEKVFYRKFIERMMRIIEVAPRNIAEFLQAYYYMRFEVLNLKRILRGKFSGLSAQQIVDSLVPIEPYHARDLGDLAKAETLEDAIKQLKDTLYSSLATSLEIYKKLEALWPLELTLNHVYARTILRSVEGLPYQDRVLVRQIVEFETDIENLLIAVKQRSASERILEAHRLDELFPVTYRVGPDKIKEVVEARDIKPVISEIGYPYSEILAPLYEGDVAFIRTRLRQHIYRTARQGRLVNDFGFNVIMAYLVFCEIEKDDLVGIAWGKAQGIPSEDILKYLVVPHSI